MRLSISVAITRVTVNNFRIKIGQILVWPLSCSAAFCFLFVSRYAASWSLFLLANSTSFFRLLIYFIPETKGKTEYPFRQLTRKISCSNYQLEAMKQRCDWSASYTYRLLQLILLLHMFLIPVAKGFSWVQCNNKSKGPQFPTNQLEAFMTRICN